MAAGINGVPLANAKSGHPDNVVSPGFKLVQIAQGTDKLENPSGLITNFGVLNDGVTQKFEPTRTEPDENLYVVFDHNLGGPTPGFNYGRHYLFQGHENGVSLAYVTRINLDVKDPAHRITLLTPVGADGKTGFGSIDGSVWNPFSKTLLFTQERGSGGGVIEITPDWPSAARTLDGFIGKGGFEGIHPDDKGNLWIEEDAGGPTTNVDPGNPSSPKTAKQANSFVFRFVPKDITNLSKGGVLQALQVTIDGQPLVFGGTSAAQIQADVFAVARLKLNTPGTNWPAKFVNVHDSTACAPSCPAFDANAAAKAAAPHRSSGQKMESSVRAQTSRASSSPRRVTQTRTPAHRPWPPAAHGDQSFAWTSEKTTLREGFPSSSWAMPITHLSTTSLF